MEDYYETSISEVDGQMVAFFGVFDGISWCFLHILSGWHFFLVIKVMLLPTGKITAQTKKKRFKIGHACPNLLLSYLSSPTQYLVLLIAYTSRVVV